MQNILYYLKKYGKDIITYTLLLVILSFIIYNTFLKKENTENIEKELVYTELDYSENNEIEKETNKAKIFIDIKGAIKKPGVYEIDNNAIINDVIKLAGGFNSNAYKDGINLSKKLKDETVIYVYTKDEIKNSQVESSKSNITANNPCNVPDYSICECVNEKSSIIEIGESNTDKNDNNTEVKTVNINNATISELSTLNGIGESKAQAIIQYREDNGNFTKIEDIMNVSGIGEKAFEKIKDFITI